MVARLIAVAILSCVTGCYVRHVGPFGGEVTDAMTQQGIPGVLIEAKYSGVGIGFPEAKPVQYGIRYTSSDGNGRFTFPRRWFVVGLTSSLDAVNVRAIHPFYGSSSGERLESVAYLDTVNILLIPLEQYCLQPSRPGSFVDGEMRFGPYFDHAGALGLPVNIDKALSHWRDLQRKYPDKAGRIRCGIAALGVETQ
jgi:hypothetical protein